jgi:hypothetical protein
MFAAACVVALTPACRRDAPHTVSTTSDSVKPSDSGAETFFRYGLKGVGHTRAELADSLGAPDSVTARAVKNRHVPEQTDSIITLHYPGLDAEIYRVSADGNELLASVTVRDNRYIQETAPVRIGMSSGDLENVMGQPTDSVNDAFSYVCTTCTAMGNERIEVKMSGDHVAAVTIFYSYD